MIIAHVADLHLGKEMYTHSIEKDQQFMLDRILEKTEECGADALVVAGDVYDTANAPRSAMKMLDSFLYRASKICKVYVVPGNHDSASLINYGGRFMEGSDVHVIGAYEGEMYTDTVKDEFGELDICLLPYIRPTFVEQYFEEEIKTQDDAFNAIFRKAALSGERRRILVCHQNISHGGKNAYRGGSESTIIGNDPAVSSSVFEDFQYVAAGHIHKPQVIDGKISYSGCPMVYDKTEIGTEKGMNIVKIGDLGEAPRIEFVPLAQLHGWRIIEGDFESLVAQAKEVPEDCFVYTILTEPAKDVTAHLKKYCNVLHTEYKYGYAGIPGVEYKSAEEMHKTSPEDLMDELFLLVKGKKMSEAQRAAFSSVVAEIDGGAKE